MASGTAPGTGTCWASQCSIAACAGLLQLVFVTSPSALWHSAACRQPRMTWRRGAAGAAAAARLPQPASPAALSAPQPSSPCAEPCCLLLPCAPPALLAWPGTRPLVPPCKGCCRCRCCCSSCSSLITCRRIAFTSSCRWKALQQVVRASLSTASALIWSSLR
jgi:hypothetical protein